LLSKGRFFPAFAETKTGVSASTCCTCLQNKLLKEPVEGFRRISAQTRVYFGGLYDGTAGSREPAEPRSHIQLGYWPCCGTARANLLERPEVFFQFNYINSEVKRTKPLRIQRDGGL
jgi:hypothetical protein